ncbi:MAG: pilus assembly protein [Devosia sp.]|jgi:Flp pilus assembly protein TadG|nr:pilus assembly protein [Devosia sp.]
MKRWHHLVDLIRRWREDTGGAAVVEFALILPVMLTLYVGSLEASVLITMDRKVQSVAGAVGDLVARSDEVVTASQLNDYFQAATGILAPYPAITLKQVVTSVQVLADGTTTVAWSEGFNGGSEHTVGVSYPLPDAVKTIALGKYIIVAEASTSFQPLMGIIFTQDIPLYRQSFFMPRFEGKAIVCSGC